MLNAELIGARVPSRGEGGEGATEINKRGAVMSYMWIGGLQNRKIGAEQSYILYSNTIGRQRAKGQGRMYMSGV